MPECVEWTGAKNTEGYGLRRHSGCVTGAHRVAYCEHRDIPLSDIAGLVVRHTCDNPSCVNPDHLLIGTHADNMRDKVERNRHNRGEEHFRAALTWDDVDAIRAAYIPRHPEYGARALAQQYGINPPAVSKIVNYHNWKPESRPVA